MFLFFLIFRLTIFDFFFLPPMQLPVQLGYGGSSGYLKVHLEMRCLMLGNLLVSRYQ